MNGLPYLLISQADYLKTNLKALTHWNCDVMSNDLCFVIVYPVYKWYNLTITEDSTSRMPVLGISEFANNL